MESSKKILLSTIGIAILVVFLSGVTFAFFNYTRTGASNTVRVGRISFVTNQTDTISLTNLFPIDPTETGIMNDDTKVGTLEITIEGDTDYSNGIEYLVSSVESSIYTNQGQIVPISLDVTVEDLGTSSTNYFTARENTNESIYKKIVGDTLVGDQMLLVGYIKPNTTSGTADGIDGSITIKAYLDENKILISDTYDGTESGNMGTPNSLAQGKTVLTTTEWNSLQSSGLSFKVKVEANEGIWVNGSLEEIMGKSAVMDNINSDYVDNTTPGINFGAISSDTNGKGVYMRAGTETDAYPIMYYRGAVTDNNVVFANKCWKAVRTTDTGGVKLLYNGEAKNMIQGVASNDYNITTNTNNMFSYDNTTTKWTGVSTSTETVEFEFTVPAGDNYIFDVEVRTSNGCGGALTISKNDSTIYTTSNGGGVIIPYTYNAGTLTSTDKIKFTFAGSGASAAYPLTYIFQMYQSTGTILGKSCDNSGTNTQITLNISGTDVNTFAFNTNYNSPAYNGYMYGTVYEYSTANWTSGARFGSSFTWDGTNYKLVNASVITPNATHHYSCNSTDAEAMCTDLRYVYYVSGSTKYYVTLTGGDGIEEALTKMQTNSNDSNAKDKIDTWYASNMTSYTNKLEDTIWCNDRSFGDNNNNGWIANGGDLSYLYYGAKERSNLAQNTSTVKNQPSLACANKNDRFTVNNGNGNQALEYPVALLTEDEIVLAGGSAGVTNSTFYLTSGATWWSLSPGDFGNYLAYEFTLINAGYLSLSDVGYSGGLRPSISLKPGTPVVSGTGTVLDPYVVE